MTCWRVLEQDSWPLYLLTNFESHKTAHFLAQMNKFYMCTSLIGCLQVKPCHCHLSNHSLSDFFIFSINRCALKWHSCTGSKWAATQLLDMQNAVEPLNSRGLTNPNCPVAHSCNKTTKARGHKMQPQHKYYPFRKKKNYPFNLHYPKGNEQVSMEEGTDCVCVILDVWQIHYVTHWPWRN